MSWCGYHGDCARNRPGVTLLIALSSPELPSHWPLPGGTVPAGRHRAQATARTRVASRPGRATSPSQRPLSAPRVWDTREPRIGAAAPATPARLRLADRSSLKATRRAAWKPLPSVGGARSGVAAHIHREKEFKTAADATNGPSGVLAAPPRAVQSVHGSGHAADAVAGVAAPPLERATGRPCTASLSARQARRDTRYTMACNAGSKTIYSPTRVDARCDRPVLVKQEGPSPVGGSYPALLTSKVSGRAVAVCMCACLSASAACVSI